jgi:hypothetical protein
MQGTSRAMEGTMVENLSDTFYKKGCCRGTFRQFHQLPNSVSFSVLFVAENVRKGFDEVWTTFSTLPFMESPAASLCRRRHTARRSLPH